jgi:hypothetical protein
MTIIGIIVLTFALFALSRVVLRIKDHSISFGEGLFWVMLWALVILVAIFPNLATTFAKTIGMERGLDSIILVAVLVLFYSIFRLYIKLESLDKDITNINTETSKRLHSKK